MNPFKTLIFLLLIILQLSSIAVGAAVNSNAQDIKQKLRQLDTASVSREQKEKIARELIHLSNEIGYAEGTLHASYILATTFFFRQQYQESYSTLDSILILLNSRGKESLQPADLEDKIARVYSFMGMIFDEIGDYGKAMDFYLKSLTTVEQAGDNYQKAVLYKNLGMTNIAIGNIDKANQYFSNALSICEVINDKKTVFDIHNALQHYYTDSARYDTALLFGVKLLGIAREINDDYSLALANNAIGNTYLKSGQKILAEGYLTEAIKLSVPNHFETITAQSLIGLSSLKILNGNLNEARELSEHALAISEKSDIINLKTQASESLAMVFEKMNDPVNALKYYKIHQYYKEDESQKKNARSVLEMQTRFEMDKVHGEKLLLEDQLLIKQYQVSKRNYILAGTFIGLISLLFFMILFIKRYRHVRQLNQQLNEQQQIINEQEAALHLEKEQALNLEIEHKNRELTSIAMALAQENEFKHHLIEELDLLKKELGPLKKQEIKSVNSIISSIKQHISNNSWEEFRTYFENVYSTFYHNLNSSFPSLNQNEKKLCAMLKLGLNTKEIAMLTYREIKSIESARNRLRKKLNLDSKTNLSVFFSKF